MLSEQKIALKSILRSQKNNQGFSHKVVAFILFLCYIFIREGATIMSRNNNDISNRSSVSKAIQNIDGEYMKKKWAFTLAVDKLNVKRIESEEEMEDRIQQLFNLCSQMNEIPTYEAIAVACGLPIRTFYDMNKGEFEGYKQYSQIIKRAKQTISLIESNLARDGKIPSALWIFRAKNYQGMRDNIQIEAVSNQSGDVPNQSGVALEELPEAPNVGTVGEAVVEKVKEKML